ncbi:MAG: putative cysteine protease YraA [Paracidovorax wautersii]|uniref:Putative cysteine protease YraA n=1 Tax=Paracidovorax wautersii TaxID=1177982 RepID=A0A7V8FQV3_9BURK|nr:MAG: putative cysteine protease YraA [Paracidovorax wautersii]
MAAISSDTNSQNLPRLDGRKVAILVTDGFEQVELTGPKSALEEAGAQTTIIAPSTASNGQVQGFNHHDKADALPVDATLAQADPAQFDAVLLPGGVINADALRTDERAQAFVRAVDHAGKPVAVICHGAWLLASADLARGRTLTSWPSLQDDLRNAGAAWVDAQVHTDRNWISSRKPDDVPAFSRAFAQALAA